MSADALQTLRGELARLHELAGFPSLDTILAVLADHGVAIAQDEVAAVLTAATLPGQEATLHVAAALADRAGDRALGRDRERDRFVYLWADAADVPLGFAAQPLTAPASDPPPYWTGNPAENRLARMLIGAAEEKDLEHLVMALNRRGDPQSVRIALTPLRDRILFRTKSHDHWGGAVWLAL